MDKPIDRIVYNSETVKLTLRDIFLKFPKEEVVEFIDLYMEKIDELKAQIAELEQHKRITELESWYNKSNP